MATRPPLTPKSASITTAAVEIKAMTVNGKQVTLAVFRQLYDEPLYDPLTWKAAGTPWCRVNYHPDKCERDEATHEHVIWQKDDELRRSRVDQPDLKLSSIPRFKNGHQDAAALCIANGTFNNLRIIGVRPARSDAYTTVRAARGPGKNAASVEIPEAYIEATFDDGPLRGKLTLSSTQIADYVREFGQQPHPGLASAHTRAHPDPEECHAFGNTLGHLLAQQNRWIEMAQQRWNEIRDLDQVFIAI